MYDNATEEIKDNKSKKDEPFKLATVTGLYQNGCAKLTFAGEEKESTKEYSFLDSYVPATNDVVLCAKTNSTYVILGKVNYNVAPNPSITDDEIVELVTTNDDVTDRIKEVANDCIDDNKHLVKTNSYNRIYRTSQYYSDYFQRLSSDISTFGTVGFNGKSAQSAKTIYYLGSSSDTDKAEACRQKINEIIENLKEFGLFD